MGPVYPGPSVIAKQIDELYSALLILWLKYCFKILFFLPVGMVYEFARNIAWLKDWESEAGFGAKLCSLA
jgi:hypothetical protein